VRSPARGAWYNAGTMSDEDQRVATYEYDGLPTLDPAERPKAEVARRPPRAARPAASRVPSCEKIVTNQGIGVVNKSDVGGITGIEAGNRHERYYYSGWRLVEVRNASDQVLGQFVYGTQYIDEPRATTLDTAWPPRGPARG
jgi:hypothetical protein